MSEIKIQTPEKWVQFLRDLDLQSSKETLFELSASHLVNPSINNGVYTEYSRLEPIYRESRLVGHEVFVTSRSGKRGDTINYDSLAPVVIPNPVSIHFDIDKDSLPYAFGFLDKFQDAGYRPSGSNSGLYLTFFREVGDTGGLIMGHERTTLRNLDLFLSEEGFKNLIKYGVPYQVPLLE